MELEKLLNELINEKLYQIVLSNPRTSDDVSAKKIKIRPVMLKKELERTNAKWNEYLNERWPEEM